MEVTSVNLGNLGNNYWVRVSGQLGITYPNILQFPPIPRPSQPVPSVSTTWTSGQLLSSKAWAESRNGGVCTAQTAAADPSSCPRLPCTKHDTPLREASLFWGKPPEGHMVFQAFSCSTSPYLTPPDEARSTGWPLPRIGEVVAPAKAPVKMYGSTQHLYLDITPMCNPHRVYLDTPSRVQEHLDKLTK